MCVRVCVTSPTHFLTELLGLVARCMGHADVASLLSRQLMPVLRLLDAEFKAHDLRQCSASIRAFLWLALRLRHPHAGAFANPLVSLTMRVLDRHETAYKVIAIRILSHLLAEADATQIRWHGELLFDTLKRQLVYREEAITTPLLPALTRCAIILEVAPGGARNTELLMVRVALTQGHTTQPQNSATVRTDKKKHRHRH